MPIWSIRLQPQKNSPWRKMSRVPAAAPPLPPLRSPSASRVLAVQMPCNRDAPCHMSAWTWGEKYPDFMDTLVPTASELSAMSGRGWMLRRLITDRIRNDPNWNNGNYTEQPRSARFASVFYGIATAGGTLAYQKLAPT